MSRVLLATTLAAAGASAFLTSSCPEIDIDIACHASGCDDVIVLIHGPEGKFYDPLEFQYVAGAAYDEIAALADHVNSPLTPTLAGVQGYADVDTDKLCGNEDGKGIKVIADGTIGPVDNVPQFTMAPENNGSGCKCSDMYFTILVTETTAQTFIPAGLLGALYNHKLESTSEESVAYGSYLIEGASTQILDFGTTAFTVKFTPDGSSTSSWLNWWIFSHWF